MVSANICLTCDRNSLEIITLSAAGSKRATHCFTPTFTVTIGSEASIEFSVRVRKAFGNRLLFSFGVIGDDKEVCAIKLTLVGSDSLVD